MSPRTLVGLLLCWTSVGVPGCGTSATEGGGKEPRNAKEKQRLEAKQSGEADSGKKWGGWRYQGERNDCFFVVGRRCFKTENAACQAARCKAPKKCESTGAGPATMSCAK